MFAPLPDDYIEIVLKKAETYIIADRLKYMEPLKFIQEYAKKHEILISDINMILDITTPYIEFVELYDENPDQISKKITKELCSKFGNDIMVTMLTNNQEYVIDYNLRRICTIYILKNSEDYNIANLKEFTKNSFHLLHPIMELIDIYDRLYKIEHAKDWESLLTTSVKLDELTMKSINQMKKYEFKMNTKKIDVLLTAKKLMCDFLQESDYILLGVLAEYIVSSTPMPLKMFEIIIIEPIATLLNKLTIYFDKYTNLTIIYKTRDIYIPKDQRIIKYSLYIKSANDVFNILNVYNIGTYIPIPYFIHNDYKIADYSVLCRFLLINIFTSIIKEKQVNQDTFNLYNIYKKKINIYERKQLIGTYIPMSIYKKEQMEIIIKKLKIQNRLYCKDV